MSQLIIIQLIVLSLCTASGHGSNYVSGEDSSSWFDPRLHPLLQDLKEEEIIQDNELLDAITSFQRSLKGQQKGNLFDAIRDVGPLSPDDTTSSDFEKLSRALDEETKNIAEEKNTLVVMIKRLILGLVEQRVREQWSVPEGTAASSQEWAYNFFDMLSRINDYFLLKVRMQDFIGNQAYRDSTDKLLAVDEESLTIDIINFQAFIALSL